MSSLETLLDTLESVQNVSLSTAKAYYGEQHQALPLVVVETELCHAVIAIQGAHVIEFTPKHQSPLLWVSPKVEYKSGKAIRGGVPICFPWFGENQLDKSQPSHGFVRNRDWQLSEASAQTNGEIELRLSFSSDETTYALFPYHFKAEYKITLGRQLKLALTVNNESEKTMPVSFALHSYHPVKDLAQTQIEGLNWTSFLDNTQSYQAHIQQGPVAFNGEVDRIYLNVPNEQVIKTEPAIKLSSQTCNSAVVWNPGFDKADSMGDLGGENYQQFVCVERGNAFSDSWYLAANEVKTAELEISQTI